MYYNAWIRYIGGEDRGRGRGRGGGGFSIIYKIDLTVKNNGFIGLSDEGWRDILFCLEIFRIFTN